MIPTLATAQQDVITEGTQTAQNTQTQTSLPYTANQIQCTLLRLHGVLTGFGVEQLIQN